METLRQSSERPARLFRLESDRIIATITDYGGALMSLEVPDRARKRSPVLLGFDNAEAYKTAHGSFGALLGRNANRIAGGKITIGGQFYRLAKNEPNATLHGGPAGFGKRFWSVDRVEARRLILSLTSADGDEGFPGEVTVTATYSLEEGALRLAFDAETSKPTPLTLSAHPYFNLDGLDARDCLDHRVTIFAAHFLPTDASQIPTGEIAAVVGTPFDFQEPHTIGERIRQDHPQLRYGRGYDHYFILPVGDTGETLRLAARIEGAKSGRILEISTTQRGLQFYSGNNLDGSQAGRGGLYRQSAGFAVEPQGFPDAPNQTHFPSTILRPGERYHEEIIYRFSVSGSAP